MTLWFSVLFDWYLTDKYTHAKKSVSVWTLCFSPDNVYLATFGEDFKIRVSLEFCKILLLDPIILSFLRSGKLARRVSATFLKTTACRLVRSISYPMAGLLPRFQGFQKSGCGICALVPQLFSKVLGARFGVFVVAQMGDMSQQELKIWY